MFIDFLSKWLLALFAFFSIPLYAHIHDGYPFGPDLSLFCFSFALKLWLIRTYTKYATSTFLFLPRLKIITEISLLYMLIDFLFLQIYEHFYVVLEWATGL